MHRFSIFRWFSESWCSGRPRVSGGYVVFQPVYCRKLFLAVTAAILFVVNPAFAQAPATAPVRPSQTLHTLPLTKFYDTPHPLPAGKPGELIRSEPFDEYELPPEVSAVRILYHSRSASGEDVATSGVVLIPSEKKPPAGGWPVIAWAHGATGVARPCAPSLMRNIGHGPLLSMYVNLGYAVVATDYTGLGTNFRNAFLDAQSNATDVIGSVSAARAAVPQLGARWIVMGEGEGSLAADRRCRETNRDSRPRLSRQYRNFWPDRRKRSIRAFHAGSRNRHVHIPGLWHQDGVSAVSSDRHVDGESARTL